MRGSPVTSHPSLTSAVLGNDTSRSLSHLSDISTSAGEDAALPSASPTDVALLSDDDSWSSEGASK